MKIQLAVVGAHLRGQPLNHQLIDLDAAFVEQTLTAPNYRLFVLANVSPRKPGMIRSQNGASIEVEIWELAPAEFGMFVATIPSPLVIGSVELASGRWLKGFLCEEIALAGAREITNFGGWRAYLASRKS